MVMVSVSIVNFRLMTDNVSRTEAKIRAEGHAARAPNEGRIAPMSRTPQSRKPFSIAANAWWWWSEKLGPFLFFRRLRSYRGLGRCSEVGSTHAQEDVGVVLSLSILRPWRKPLRAAM